TVAREVADKALVVEPDLRVRCLRRKDQGEQALAEVGRSVERAGCSNKGRGELGWAHKAAPKVAGTSPSVIAPGGGARGGAQVLRWLRVSVKVLRRAPRPRRRSTPGPSGARGGGRRRRPGGRGRRADRRRGGGRVSMGARRARPRRRRGRRLRGAG